MTNAAALAKVRPPRSLVDQTYEILLDAICAGDLVPGERLNQDRIAESLNVSRQPVISAISILKANRLVEDTGRRGVVVAPLDPGLVRSIYEYRVVIEPFAVRLAAGRRPPEARAEAAEVIAAGRAAAQSGDVRELIRADARFHEMIYRWSGNAMVQNSMGVNWHHIRRTMAEVLKAPLLSAPVWDEHAAILNALLDGDAATAEQLMRRHIETAVERLAGRDANLR
ncbi:MAG: GntR family transcriptional regulator [Rhodobacteraceae bacterium]|jgi:DNA-binding GntR family transcriptional regulator|nr:GntR family transcriptional regulator [Paracoccaceae bacterium]